MSVEQKISKLNLVIHKSNGRDIKIHNILYLETASFLLGKSIMKYDDVSPGNVFLYLTASLIMAYHIL